MIKVQGQGITVSQSGENFRVKFDISFDKVPPQGFVMPKGFPKYFTLGFPMSATRQEVEQKILDTINSLNERLKKLTRREDNEDPKKISNLNAYFAGKVIK